MLLLFLPTLNIVQTEALICVWQEWAGSRAAQDGGILDPLTTPLLQLSPESLAYWMGKFVLEGLLTLAVRSV